MHIRVVWMLKLLIVWQCIRCSRQHGNIPSNPCAELFQYYKDGRGEVFGRLELPTTQRDKLEITVELMIPASDTDNNMGRLVLAHNTSELLQRRLEGKPIVFDVRFPLPQGPIPQLLSVEFNNKLICSGRKDFLGDVITIRKDLEIRYPGRLDPEYNPPLPSQLDPEYRRSPSFRQDSDYRPSLPVLPDFEYRPPTPVRREPDDIPQHKPSTTSPPRISPPVRDTTRVKDICGIRYSETGINPLIVGGKKTRRDEWPWLAAIYVNQPNGLDFICGGSLISSRAVITAAHCIKQSNVRYSPHEMIVYLGRYSLTNWHEAGSIQAEIANIFVHSDYSQKVGSFDADIAILVLKEDVRFTERVRPICLWLGEKDFQEIDGLNGTVVGWGTDGNDSAVSNVPKKIDLPIVDALTCVQKSRSLTHAMSIRTFCAGTLGGDGPCHGDSGGALMLHHMGRWTLRGIVSFGKGDEIRCDLEEYVVFTDAASFVEWILDHISL